jgi:hypothetical protein
LELQVLRIELLGLVSKNGQGGSVCLHKFRQVINWYDSSSKTADFPAGDGELLSVCGT